MSSSVPRVESCGTPNDTSLDFEVFPFLKELSHKPAQNLP